MLVDLVLESIAWKSRIAAAINEIRKLFDSIIAIRKEEGEVGHTFPTRWEQTVSPLLRCKPR